MISVVMAYYKRPEHLRVTLESYNYFYKSLDYEVVVIEDTSSDQSMDCLRVLNASGIKFKHENVDRSHKEFHNPGVLYNRAVEIADGDIIHITNPENMHFHPILTHCLDHITEENYVVYACRTLNAQPDSFLAAQGSLDQITNWGEARGWYQHSVIYSRLLHFSTIISKKLYKTIGGFDPRFDDGIGYEDNDFIRRVKSFNIPVLTFDDLFSGHQSHDRGHWAGMGGLYKNQAVYREIWNEDTIEHWRN
jgi:GT2 family glycosyltransferase